MDLKIALEIIGAAIALVALVYTAYSVGISRKTSRAEFWLELRDRFSTHDAVHRRLRPGGDWARFGAGPNTAEDWANVEAYMGLFEHCEVMLSEKLIDLKTFKSIYGYRVANILACEMIAKEKLIKRRDGWTTFLALVRRLGMDEPEVAD